MNSKALWTITTLTPLHIGSGQKLYRGIDYIEHTGALWIANQDKLFNSLLEEMEITSDQEDLPLVIKTLTGRTLTELEQAGILQEKHFDLRTGLFRYFLPGQSSAQHEYKELVEFIKDIDNRPYIPGSSLKGALRSIVLRKLVDQDQGNLGIRKKTINRRGNEIEVVDPVKTAQLIEQHHFIKAPQKHETYYDLWRAMRISDSLPIEIQKHALGLWWIFPMRSRNRVIQPPLPVAIEVVPAGTSFEIMVTVDEWLFNNAEARTELQFSPYGRSYLQRDLRDIVNWDTRLRINEEYRFYTHLSQGLTGNLFELVRSATDNIRVLATEYSNLQDDEMLLQIGKGSGWLGKSLGRLLRQKLSPEEFDMLVRDTELGKGTWKASSPDIPFTRQLCSTQDQRYAPPGWVKVTRKAIP